MTPDKKSGDHFADREYLKLMDVVSDGVAVYERKGSKFIIRDFNRSAERIEKVKRADVVGKDVIEIFPGIKKMGLFPVFERVWKTGKSEKHPAVVYEDERISGWRENEVIKLKSGLVAVIYRDLTREKSQQRRSDLEKESLIAAMDALSDPVVTVDLSFKVIAANTSARDFLREAGVSDPIGKDILRIAPVINKKEARSDYLEVIGKNKSIEREVAYEVGGRIMYSKTRRVPLVVGGKVSGIVLALRDITKEKNAEKALRESMGRFNHVADITGSMLWESDMSGLITYVSPATEKILGYKPLELVGVKRYAELLDPKIREKIEPLIKKGYAKHQEFRNLVVRAVKKNGDIVILQLSGAPIFDDEGIIVGYAGMSEDITDIQNHEENLRKFQLAVENASDHIIITDPDGVILYANKATSVITGYAIREMIGNRPSLWGKQMPVDFYKGMWRTIKDLKEPFIGEVTNKRKSGEIYIAESKISPILDSEGKVKFFVGIERDITKAKEVDRAKSEFVSLASHQLRTPLSIINWYTEMLIGGDKGALTDDQKSYIDEIHRSNHRMIELVNALLNTSRIDMGTLMIDPKPMNLSEVSDIVISELAFQIAKKKIVIDKDYDELPLVKADPDLIRIIFQNLLSNAVKYTPDEGSVAIKMRKDDKNVYITVADNGYGIPKAQQSKVFTKLFRADNARALDPDGTGLGLYIVKAIIDAAGGNIEFTSEEGKGTQFDVSMPISGMRPKEGSKGLV